MELLRRELPKYGGSFIQCEDEIASVSMAIGASYGGRVAVTGSSWPRHLAEDGGDRLGGDGRGAFGGGGHPARRPVHDYPQNVEQSDLNIACFGGHGDSPRVVLAAANVEDCFYTAMEAVDIARRYSVPVMLLSDQAIATRIEAFDEPKLEEICQDLTPGPDANPDPQAVRP